MIQKDAHDVTRLAASLKAGELFAILDACDAPAVPVLCHGLGEARAVSLYRGDAEEQFADIAPYLVHIDSGAMLDWVLRFSVTPGWGVFVVAPHPLDLLRTHFRRFLKVAGPDGQRLYFRFYDPRVLEAFLPTCTDAQLTQFMGPLRAFVLANGPEALTACRRT